MDLSTHEALRGGRGEPPRLLLEALAAVCGRSAADALVAEALSEAQLTALPASRDGVISFVRRHMLSLLTDALGALDAARFFADLLSALEAGPDRAPPPTRSSPPAPAVGPAAARRVLVVGTSRSERQRLARAFYRAGNDVRVVERLADFVELAGHGGPTPAAMVVLLSSPSALPTAQEIAGRMAGLVVVAIGEDPASRADAEARLLAAGLRPVVLAGTLPPTDVVAVVTRALG